MPKHPANRSSLILIAAMLCALWATVALAQTTAFTYQAQLNDNGNPANGPYDLQFRLFDAAAGGTQQGPALGFDDVQVSNGIFKATMDFGVAAFTGGNRWLEISLRPGASTGTFTTLIPRQQLTSTPYSVRSLLATSADGLSVACVNCVTSSQIGSLPAGSGNYVQNTVAPQASSNFNISGNGTAGGTLSGNIVNAVAQINLNASRVLSNGGTDNLFAGVGAGAANPSSTSNSFFGVNAGQATSTGGSNTFLGKSAGAANTAGASNTFTGNNAGLTNNTGNNNTFIGFSAGAGNTGGSFNAALGWGSIVGGGNQFATALGARAEAACSNCLVLGAVQGVNGATTTANIGIGTQNPTSRLHVVGDSNLLGNLTFSGALNGSGANLTNLNASNIATGTLAATRGGTGLIDSGPAGNFLRSDGNREWTSSALQASDLPSDSTAYIQNRTTLQSSSNFNISGNGFIGGNFGVGTTTPTDKLTVRTGTASYGLTHTDGIATVGSWVGAFNNQLSGWFGTKSNHPFHLFVNNGNPSLTVATNTNVGIGTITPTAKLEVAGTGLFTGTLSASTTSATGISGTSSATNGKGVSGVANNGSDAYGVYGNNIGIGVGVRGDSTDGIGVSGYSNTGIGVFALSSGSGRYDAALFASNFNTTNGMAAYMLNNSNFATAHFANQGAGEVLYLQNGISGGPFIRAVNSAETATLFSVNGDGTTVTKVLQITGGSDLSEQFDISSVTEPANDAPSSAPQPGLVVSIDPENPGKLVVSHEAYDRKVAGIISGAGGIQTGMLMGQTGSVADGKQPVALTGRVYCWVDATNGPINPGDLLTTSPIPGHAMKVTDHTKAQGAIIGKAMTGLKEGKGLVLVLVSLQ